MRCILILASFILGLSGLTGCGDFETRASLISCKSDADCVETTDGEFDVCGQEGADLCCVGGYFKCGCAAGNVCENDNVCFDCNDLVCPLVQTTICLDETSGSLAGLEPASSTSGISE